MKYLKNKNLFAVIIFFLNLITVVPAQPVPQSELLYRKGIEEFLKGMFESSIMNLEEALKLSPEDIKIKEFLSKVLTETSSSFYLQKNYQEALKCLFRARELNPQDKKIQELIALINQKNQPQEIKEGEKKLPEQNLTEIMRKFQEDNIKSMEKVINRMTVKEYIEKADNEKLQLISMLENERKIQEINQKELIKKFYRNWIIVFLATIILVFSVMFTVFHFLSVKKENKLIYHQEKIWQILRQANNLPEGPQKLDFETRAVSREIITDIDPKIRERARHVEAIEKELEGENDTQIALSMLSPFLHDPNSRIRANAAKAIHKYSRQISLNVLKEMLTLDKWMRLSAAWALGEIGGEDGAELLLKLVQDPEHSVVRRTVESLKKIVAVHDSKISEKIKKSIYKLLEAYNVKV